MRIELSGKQALAIATTGSALRVEGGIVDRIARSGRRDPEMAGGWPVC